MTLRRRLGSNHIRGGVRSSTFRLTLAAALRESLHLALLSAKRLDSASERRVSEWIASNLEVAVHPFTDPDPLADLEDQVLARLDPPLNLVAMTSTPLRRRLAELRAVIAQGVLASEPERAAVVPQTGRTTRRLPSSDRPTLHDELAAILRESSAEWMTRDELARRVNERGLYHKRDGGTVTSFQVARRAHRYRHLFRINGSRIALA